MLVLHHGLTIAIAQYLGLPQSLLTSVQMVQNAVDWQVTSIKKQEYITPVQASLHWLPVQFKIHFRFLRFSMGRLHLSQFRKFNQIE